jgi:predicted small secreted protein
MKKSAHILLVATVFIALFSLSGCNTVKGIGEDFEAMGESIQNAGN